jgi:hypothetical protein
MKDIPEIKQRQNLKDDVMKSRIQPETPERGACYSYVINSNDPKTDKKVMDPVVINFQKGDPRDGINGIREEDLLNILIHRTESFAKNYPNQFTNGKLTLLKSLLAHCNKRVKERIEEGATGNIKETKIKEGLKNEKRK